MCRGLALLSAGSSCACWIRGNRAGLALKAVGGIDPYCNRGSICVCACECELIVCCVYWYKPVVSRRQRRPIRRSGNACDRLGVVHISREVTVLIYHKATDFNLDCRRPSFLLQLLILYCRWSGRNTSTVAMTFSISISTAAT